MKFVSRAGEKLEFALKEFGIDVKNKICADFGSSTGGFVDCLLQKGADKVYAVDTAKGMLKYKLIEDPRVEVVKANAMHADIGEQVDFVSIDVGWTRQMYVVPNALKNLKIRGDIIALIKPQYEADRKWLTSGTLEEKYLDKTMERVKDSLRHLEGMKIMKVVRSPIKGQKGKNVEFLMWIKKL